MNIQKKIKAIFLLTVLLGSLLFSINVTVGKNQLSKNQLTYSIGEMPDEDKISFIRNSEEEVNSNRVSIYFNHQSGSSWRLLHESTNQYFRNFINVTSIHKVKLYLQQQRLLI